MNEKETKFLLDIYERFGDKAQQALDFIKKNDVIQLTGQQAQTQPQQKKEEILARLSLTNGVYLVHPDKTFVPYSEDAKVVPDTRVGISWDGHRWLVGNDYGNLPWTKADGKELTLNTVGIMNEYEAVLDWDVYPKNFLLRKFFKHIPFTEDEMMPTCPMVLVMEHLAKLGPLNDALKMCWQPEYETGVTHWFVERRNALNPRVFEGAGGYLTYYGVDNYYRVQAVMLW